MDFSFSLSCSTLIKYTCRFIFVIKLSCILALTFSQMYYIINLLHYSHRNVHI